MIYSYGARVDDNSNAITVIDEENETAVTTGYVNGEYVEFSGGGSSDFSTATLTLNNPTEQIFSAPIIMFASARVPFDFIVTGEGNVPSGIYTIALYNGNAVARTPIGHNIETVGAIEPAGLNQYHITGDCTITIS